MEPVMEAPRTKRGKREVSWDRIWSIFELDLTVSLLSLGDDSCSVVLVLRLLFDLLCIIVGVG